MSALAAAIKEQARAIGFDLVGIAPAAPADSFDRLRDWLAQGFAGEMGYLERYAEARREPASILPEVRSVVMVALYYEADPPPTGPARIARYARGADYHDVLRARLKQLLAWVQCQVPDCRGRGVVDTAPLLERDFARRAGLGWFGKNTMLINKQRGSYCFLGALLLDIDLPADVPHETTHCGTCTRCLDACPTDAFTAPGVLDARRCISYLTIELRGPIPEDLRALTGNWLFGCDVCQEVCPWNRKPLTATDPAMRPLPELEAVDPIALLDLTEDEFRQRFRGTALFRTRRAGLARNAAIVLGNARDRAAIPALRRALHDAEEAVRDAARWALARMEAE